MWLFSAPLVAAAAGVSITSPASCTEAINKAITLKVDQDPTTTDVDIDKSQILTACFGAVIKDASKNKPANQRKPADFDCVGRKADVTITSEKTTVVSSPLKGSAMGKCIQTTVNGKPAQQTQPGQQAGGGGGGGSVPQPEQKPDPSLNDMGDVTGGMPPKPDGAATNPHLNGEIKPDSSETSNPDAMTPASETKTNSFEEQLKKAAESPGIGKYFNNILNPAGGGQEQGSSYNWGPSSNLAPATPPVAGGNSGSLGQQAYQDLSGGSFGQSQDVTGFQNAFQPEKDLSYPNATAEEKSIWQKTWDEVKEFASNTWSKVSRYFTGESFAVDNPDSLTPATEITPDYTNDTPYATRENTREPDYSKDTPYGVRDPEGGNTGSLTREGCEAAGGSFCNYLKPAAQGGGPVASAPARDEPTPPAQLPNGDTTTQVAQKALKASQTRDANNELLKDYADSIKAGQKLSPQDWDTIKEIEKENAKLNKELEKLHEDAQKIQALERDRYLNAPDGGAMPCDGGECKNAPPSTSGEKTGGVTPQKLDDLLNKYPELKALERFSPTEGDTAKMLAEKYNEVQRRADAAQKIANDYAARYTYESEGKYVYPTKGFAEIAKTNSDFAQAVSSASNETGTALASEIDRMKLLSRDAAYDINNGVVPIQQVPSQADNATLEELYRQRAAIQAEIFARQMNSAYMDPKISALDSRAAQAYADSLKMLSSQVPVQNPSAEISQSLKGLQSEIQQATEQSHIAALTEREAQLNGSIRKLEVAQAQQRAVEDIRYDAFGNTYGSAASALAAERMQFDAIEKGAQLENARADLQQQIDAQKQLPWYDPNRYGQTEGQRAAQNTIRNLENQIQANNAVLAAVQRGSYGDSVLAKLAETPSTVEGQIQRDEMIKKMYEYERAVKTLDEFNRSAYVIAGASQSEIEGVRQGLEADVARLDQRVGELSGARDMSPETRQFINDSLEARKPLSEGGALGYKFSEFLDKAANGFAPAGTYGLWEKALSPAGLVKDIVWDPLMRTMGVPTPAQQSDMLSRSDVGNAVNYALNAAQTALNVLPFTGAATKTLGSALTTEDIAVNTFRSTTVFNEASYNAFAKTIQTGEAGIAARFGDDVLRPTASNAASQAHYIRDAIITSDARNAGTVAFTRTEATAAFEMSGKPALRYQSGVQEGASIVQTGPTRFEVMPAGVVRTQPFIEGVGEYTNITNTVRAAENSAFETTGRPLVFDKLTNPIAERIATGLAVVAPAESMVSPAMAAAREVPAIYQTLDAAALNAMRSPEAISFRAGQAFAESARNTIDAIPSAIEGIVGRTILPPTGFVPISSAMLNIGAFTPEYMPTPSVVSSDLAALASPAEGPNPVTEFTPAPVGLAAPDAGFPNPETSAGEITAGGAQSNATQPPTQLGPPTERSNTGGTEASEPVGPPALSPTVAVRSSQPTVGPGGEAISAAERPFPTAGPARPAPTLASRIGDNLDAFFGAIGPRSALGAEARDVKYSDGTVWPADIAGREQRAMEINNLFGMKPAGIAQVQQVKPGLFTTIPNTKNYTYQSFPTMADGVAAVIGKLIYQDAYKNCQVYSCIVDKWVASDAQNGAANREAHIRRTGLTADFPINRDNLPTMADLVRGMSKAEYGGIDARPLTNEVMRDAFAKVYGPERANQWYGQVAGKPVAPSPVVFQPRPQTSTPTTQQPTGPYTSLSGPALKQAEDAIQKEFVQRMQEKGFQIIDAVRPGAIYYKVTNFNEKPASPIVGAVSHVTYTPGNFTADINTSNSIQKRPFGPQTSYGAHIFVENCTSGQCRVAITAPFSERTNHVAAGQQRRVAGAPDLYNWNSIGIEISAPNEAAVTSAAAETLAEVVRAFGEVSGQPQFSQNVAPHAAVNHKQPGEGDKGAAATLSKPQDFAYTPKWQTGQTTIVAQNPAAQPAPSPAVSQGGSVVVKDPATGRLSLVTYAPQTSPQVQPTTPSPAPQVVTQVQSLPPSVQPRVASTQPIPNGVRLFDSTGNPVGDVAAVSKDAAPSEAKAREMGEKLKQAIPNDLILPMRIPDPSNISDPSKMTVVWPSEQVRQVDQALKNLGYAGLPVVQTRHLGPERPTNAGSDASGATNKYSDAARPIVQDGVKKVFGATQPLGNGTTDRIFKNPNDYARVMSSIKGADKDDIARGSTLAPNQNLISRDLLRTIMLADYLLGQHTFQKTLAATTEPNHTPNNPENSQHKYGWDADIAIAPNNFSADPAWFRTNAAQSTYATTRDAQFAAYLQAAKILGFDGTLRGGAYPTPNIHIGAVPKGTVLDSGKYWDQGSTQNPFGAKVPYTANSTAIQKIFQSGSTAGMNWNTFAAIRDSSLFGPATTETRNLFVDAQSSKGTPFTSPTTRLADSTRPLPQQAQSAPTPAVAKAGASVVVKDPVTGRLSLAPVPSQATPSLPANLPQGSQLQQFTVIKQSQPVTPDMRTLAGYRGSFALSSRFTFKPAAERGIEMTQPTQNHRVINSEAELAKMNQELVLSVKEASKRLPPGYSMYIFSSYRPVNQLQGSYHGRNEAIDIFIIDENGRAIANIRAPQNFRLYEDFAKEVKAEHDRMFPNRKGFLRWGGYFVSGTAQDLMHFDVGPSGKMAAGSWERGLRPEYAFYGRPGDVGRGMGPVAQYKVRNIQANGSIQIARAEPQYEIRNDATGAVTTNVSIPTARIENGKITLAVDTVGKPLLDGIKPILALSPSSVPKPNVTPAVATAPAQTTPQKPSQTASQPAIARTQATPEEIKNIREKLASTRGQLEAMRQKSGDLQKQQKELKKQVSKSDATQKTVFQMRSDLGIAKQGHEVFKPLFSEPDANRISIMRRGYDALVRLEQAFQILKQSDLAAQIAAHRANLDTLKNPNVGLGTKFTLKFTANDAGDKLIDAVKDVIDVMDEASRGPEIVQARTALEKVTAELNTLDRNADALEARALQLEQDLVVAQTQVSEIVVTSPAAKPAAAPANIAADIVPSANAARVIDAQFSAAVRDAAAKLRMQTPTWSPQVREPTPQPDVTGAAAPRIPLPEILPSLATGQTRTPVPEVPSQPGVLPDSRGTIDSRVLTAAGSGRVGPPDVYETLPWWQMGQSQFAFYPSLTPPGSSAQPGQQENERTQEMQPGGASEYPGECGMKPFSVAEIKRALLGEQRQCSPNESSAESVDQNTAEVLQPDVLIDDTEQKPDDKPDRTPGPGPKEGAVRQRDVTPPPQPNPSVRSGGMQQILSALSSILQSLMRALRGQQQSLPPGTRTTQPLPLTVVLSAKPNPVPVASSTELRWTSTGATSCYLQGPTGAKLAYGTPDTRVFISSVMSTSTYVVWCTNASGKYASSSATVNLK